MENVKRLERPLWASRHHSGVCMYTDEPAAITLVCVCIWMLPAAITLVCVCIRMLPAAITLVCVCIRMLTLKQKIVCALKSAVWMLWSVTSCCSHFFWQSVGTHTTPWSGLQSVWTEFWQVWDNVDLIIDAVALCLCLPDTVPRYFSAIVICFLHVLLLSLSSSKLKYICVHLYQCTYINEYTENWTSVKEHLSIYGK